MGRGVPSVAQRLGCFDAYVDAMFDSVWVNGKNMGDLEIVTEVLTNKGLNAEALLAGTQEPDIKAEFVALTEGAVERGAFGAPTMFMDGEMYFGQDRLDFVEETLKS